MSVRHSCYSGRMKLVALLQQGQLDTALNLADRMVRQEPGDDVIKQMVVFLKVGDFGAFSLLIIIFCFV